MSKINLQGKLRVFVEGESGYNYSFGKTVPIISRVEITDHLEGRNQDESEYFSHMIRYVGERYLRTAGTPVAQNSGETEPFEGCTMMAFFEPSEAERAGVSLTHKDTGTTTLGYGATLALAVQKANARMREKLKN